MLGPWAPELSSNKFFGRLISDLNTLFFFILFCISTIGREILFTYSVCYSLSIREKREHCYEVIFSLFKFVTGLVFI